MVSSSWYTTIIGFREKWVLEDARVQMSCRSSECSSYQLNRHVDVGAQRDQPPLEGSAGAQGTASPSMDLKYSQRETTSWVVTWK